MYIRGATGWIEQTLGPLRGAMCGMGREKKATPSLVKNRGGLSLGVTGPPDINGAKGGSTGRKIWGTLLTSREGGIRAKRERRVQIPGKKAGCGSRTF